MSRDEFAALRQRAELNAAQRDATLRELRDLLQYTRRLAGYPLEDPILMHAEAVLEESRR